MVLCRKILLSLNVGKDECGVYMLVKPIYRQVGLRLKILAKEERKHFSWLLDRMKELNVNPSERKVSLGVWNTLTSCKSAEDFCVIIADAENRGRISGERIAEYLQSEDPQTAKIFLNIAKDEIEHIRLALQFYPEKFSVFKTLKYFNS